MVLIILKYNILNRLISIDLIIVDSRQTTPSKMKLTLQKSKVGNLKEIFENITRVRHSSASRETGQSSSENEIIILKTAIGPNGQRGISIRGFGISNN